MDIKEISKKIEEAAFLSDIEKELLLDVVPHWPQTQLDNLIQALRDLPQKPKQSTAQSGKVRAGGNLSSVMDRLEKETVDLRKKIPPSAPPKQKIQPPVPPAIKSVSKPARPVASIHRKEKQVLKRKHSEQKDQQPKPDKSIKIKQLNSSKDLSYLKLSHLREGEWRKNLNLLLKKLVHIANKEEVLVYDLVKLFEKSPVNRLFISTGLALMDDISRDRKSVFERVKNQMKSAYGESFSAGEFNDFADFKDKLEEIT